LYDGLMIEYALVYQLVDRHFAPSRAGDSVEHMHVQSLRCFLASPPCCLRGGTKAMLAEDVTRRRASHSSA
jgi:hypothetical protein